MLTPQYHMSLMTIFDYFQDFFLEQTAGKQNYLSLKYRVAVSKQKNISIPGIYSMHHYRMKPSNINIRRHWRYIWHIIQTHSNTEYNIYK